MSEQAALRDAADRAGFNRPVEAPRRDLQVDIVVLNHNYARFLTDAIDSALAQTHPLVRVIVVDDGSTDDSVAVIRSYGSQVVAVLKTNGGQGSAVNAGFDAVEGDIVIFLDADDTLDPEIAHHVAAAAGQHPGASKLQWQMALVDAAMQPTGTVLPPAHVPVPHGDMRRAELTFPFDISWMAMSANAFRTDAVAQVLPMPESSYRSCADSYLTHLTSLLGPVVSIERVGGQRRMHGANAFERTSPDSLDLDRLHESIRTARLTRGHLEAFAGSLGLHDGRRSILSVSDAANRLISLRLDRLSHPTPGDSRIGLTLAGTQAALRRFDVRPPMRAAFCAWFVAMALAPQPLALQLGQWFLFPQQRRGANRLLSRLHRGHTRTG